MSLLYRDYSNERGPVIQYQKCRGYLAKSTGCTLYVKSDQYDYDWDHEYFMRIGGLGFGIRLTIADALMSMHLQSCHDLTQDKAEELIRDK